MLFMDASVVFDCQLPSTQSRQSGTKNVSILSIINDMFQSLYSSRWFCIFKKIRSCMSSSRWSLLYFEWVHLFSLRGPYKDYEALKLMGDRLSITANWCCHTVVTLRPRGCWFNSIGSINKIKSICKFAIILQGIRRPWKMFSLLAKHPHGTPRKPGCLLFFMQSRETELLHFAHCLVVLIYVLNAQMDALEISLKCTRSCP